MHVCPFQREKDANSKNVISMNGQVTTIFHPETREARTFAYDYSYWSHDGFKESPDGVYIPSANSSSENSYADQVSYTDSSVSNFCLQNHWNDGSVPYTSAESL